MSWMTAPLGDVIKPIQRGIVGSGFFSTEISQSFSDQFCFEGLKLCFLVTDSSFCHVLHN